MTNHDWREYAEDLEVMSGEVYLENDKLKKELEESRESLGYMETAYTKFQKEAYAEILDLKRIIADMKIVNERLLQGSTSTFDEYWSSQAHRCQKELEFWRNKAEELGGLLEEEQDVSTWWKNVNDETLGEKKFWEKRAEDQQEEIEQLKNMLSDSDDQNESVMSIHREERWHEKQKELMKIIDRQYFEALARDKRVTELEDQLENEKKNAMGWYESACRVQEKCDSWERVANTHNADLDRILKNEADLKAQLDDEKDICEYWHNVSTNHEDIIAQLTSEIAHWECEYNRVQSLWDHAQKEKEQWLYAAGEARKEAYVNGMEDAEKLYMKALKNAMGGNNE